jgi:hypothetical protein
MQVSGKLAPIVTENSGQKRRVFKASGTGQRESIPVRTRTSLQLYRTKLLIGKTNRVVEVLSSKETRENLRPSFSLDFRARNFQNWLEQKKLRRLPGERDLSFAWRVFLEIRNHYRYDWNPSMDRKVSNVCQLSATDCGGLSYLFCAVLRANKIPARPLIGRWAHSTAGVEDESHYFNCHVKSEFYARGVGWIPVDVSEAVANHKRDIKQLFGQDNGDFIVIHANPDLLLDRPCASSTNIRSLTDFRFWICQNGLLLGSPPRHVFWKVSVR